MDVNVGRKFEHPPGSNRYPVTTEVFFEPNENRLRDRLLSTMHAGEHNSRVVTHTDSMVVLLDKFSRAAISIYVEPPILDATELKPDSGYL